MHILYVPACVSTCVCALCVCAYVVLEIRIRNWLTVFLKIQYFVGSLTVVPLKMYGKVG